MNNIRNCSTNCTNQILAANQSRVPSTVRHYRRLQAVNKSVFSRATFWHANFTGQKCSALGGVRMLRVYVPKVTYPEPFSYSQMHLFCWLRKNRRILQRIKARSTRLQNNSEISFAVVFGFQNFVCRQVQFFVSGVGSSDRKQGM